MNNFVTYQVALDLVRALCPIVEQLRTNSSDLANQIERAGTSLVLNLGEGNRRAGKDRRRFFVMAHGSASEIRAGLDVADAWGWAVDAASAKALLDRQLRLLWGLTHPKPSPS
ncbi:MAG: four helix bundle protein [Deltaproteobacteria bacterium]|nr:four helix bundle protein [Deltaproteobacteria bacterium]